MNVYIHMYSTRKNIYINTTHMNKHTLTHIFPLRLSPQSKLLPTSASASDPAQPATLNNPSPLRSTSAASRSSWPSQPHNQHPCGLITPSSAANYSGHFPSPHTTRSVPIPPFTSTVFFIFSPFHPSHALRNQPSLSWVEL